MAASVVRGADGWSLSRKGICKERLFQKIFVITQVAISRRVHIHRLALRDRQPARERRKPEDFGQWPGVWNVDED